MLAVLYDLHGNLPALEAVLEDARDAGADRFVLGGDLAAFGAWPAETVAACDALEPVAAIRGNWERWLGGDDADLPDRDVVRGARAHALGALDPADVERLAGLPEQAEVDGTLYVHGSPAGGDMASFGPSEDPDADARLLGDASGRSRRVVFGHTHVQFARGDAPELVNPGSVGLPFDGDPRAAYALVGDDGALDLRRVAYDHGSVVAALRERREAWSDQVASWVEQGRIA